MICDNEKELSLINTFGKPMTTHSEELPHDESEHTVDGQLTRESDHAVVNKIEVDDNENTEEMIDQGLPSGIMDVEDRNAMCGGVHTVRYEHTVASGMKASVGNVRTLIGEYEVRIGTCEKEGVKQNQTGSCKKVVDIVNRLIKLKINDHTVDEIPKKRIRVNEIGEWRGRYLSNPNGFDCFRQGINLEDRRMPRKDSKGLGKRVAKL